MISKKLYDILTYELTEAQTSNNPELVERLNLASIILDKNFISSSVLVDYLKWAKDNDLSSSAIIQLFSKYIFAKRDASKGIGIYPFLSQLFEEIQELISLGEFPELKNPQDRIHEINSELSTIENKFEEYNTNLLRLSEKKVKLEKSKKELSILEQKFSSEMIEFERLDKENKELEERLNRFKTTFTDDTISMMKTRNDELHKSFIAAQNKFKNDQDIEKYFNSLRSIILEHDALEKISKYRRVLAEVFEDLEVTKNIVSETDINTAALQGAALKLNPYYEELKKELKAIVERLTQI